MLVYSSRKSRPSGSYFTAPTFDNDHFFFFNWSIVDSQCFNCIVKSFSFISKDSHCSTVKSKILVIWQRPTLSSLHLSTSQSCTSLCDPMDCSMPGFSVNHQHPEISQTHVYWVSDAIQPSPSPPAFSLPQHQGLFQWVRFSHQIAKVLKLQLQHQSFQWIFRVDFL